MNIIKIIIADDHQIVRFGLRTLLESEPDFQVVGEAVDGLEAIQMVEQRSPDVVIMDLMMPRMNGLEAARQIHAQYPHIRIVILSMFDSEAYIVEALSVGAEAYLLKQSTTEDLVKAVREVLAGKRFLSPPLNELAINGFIQYAMSAKTSESDPHGRLTPREREVLHLVAQGYTNIDIARALSLSSRTIETHRAHMMHKLGLNSPVDLARYALEHGLLPK
jgi:two-component system, NarL family, response regulator NreC